MYKKKNVKLILINTDNTIVNYVFNIAWKQSNIVFSDFLIKLVFILSAGKSKTICKTRVFIFIFNQSWMAVECEETNFFCYFFTHIIAGRSNNRNYNTDYNRLNLGLLSTHNFKISTPNFLIFPKKTFPNILFFHVNSTSILICIGRRTVHIVIL